MHGVQIYNINWFEHKYKFSTSAFLCYIVIHFKPFLCSWIILMWNTCSVWSHWKTVRYILEMPSSLKQQRCCKTWVNKKNTNPYPHRTGHNTTHTSTCKGAHFYMSPKCLDPHKRQKFGHNFAFGAPMTSWISHSPIWVNKTDAQNFPIEHPLQIQNPDCATVQIRIPSLELASFG